MKKALPSRLKMWIKHVQRHAKKYKMTYAEALKDPRTRSSFM